MFAQLAAVIYLPISREEIRKVMGPAVGDGMSTLAAQGTATRDRSFRTT